MIAIGDLTLREANAADRSFLRDLYGSTRDDELALTDWDDDRKRVFIDHQFNAQDVDYRGRHPQGEFLVIERGSRRVGRVYLSRMDDELRVLDIALVAEERGRGYGTAVMHWVMDRAAREDVMVSLHVERWKGAALRLYLRLGFEAVSENEIHYRMEWRPHRAEEAHDAGALS